MPTRAGNAGFTLIELMVVIAIIALMTQLVVMNMGALIPKTVLDSECKQLISQFDFLRSEAKLRGKTLHLELDLTNHRYQIVLPPEERVDSTQAEFQDEYELGWYDLDERARFLGYQIAGGRPLRSGKVRIAFDENGFTADQSISMTLEELPELVWTIQIRGLTGRSRLVKDNQGQEQPLEKIQEHQF